MNSFCLSFFFSLFVPFSPFMCTICFLQGHKVFAWYDGKLSAADYYVGRVNLLDNAYGYGRASVNLTSIREIDSGWYELNCIHFALSYWDEWKLCSFISCMLLVHYGEKWEFEFNAITGMSVESFFRTEHQPHEIMELGFI